MGNGREHGDRRRHRQEHHWHRHLSQCRYKSTAPGRKMKGPDRHPNPADSEANCNMRTKEGLPSCDRGSRDIAKLGDASRYHATDQDTALCSTLPSHGSTTRQTSSLGTYHNCPRSTPPRSAKHVRGRDVGGRRLRA